ncbi:MAG: hypothetical protein MUO53_03140 [Maribacter sp.]|nr:hypothetical protein [Maribacter sp.]
MMKLFSFSIASLLLIQSFNIHLGDILELDDLIEHAQFHAEAYGDNFFVFISKHYGELKAEHSQKHQEERKDHERLPFQHQCHMVSFSAFVLNQEVIEAIETDYSFLHKAANFFYLATYHSLAGDTILQPPRCA